MKILPYKGSRRIIIETGEYYASRSNEVISTLLGSCIAACLFDPVNRIFGMNHFLLAYRHHALNPAILETQEGSYGIYAMELLINEMMKLGANRLNLKAKCFGGGNVLTVSEDRENQTSVGETNVAFVKAFLQRENIPLLSASFGGDIGRTVHFVGSDYSVFVKKIDRNRQLLVEKQERRYWKRNIKQMEEFKATAEFW